MQNAVSATKSTSYLRFGLESWQINRVQVHSKSKRGDFGALELVSALRAAGDPLHLMAAEALVNLATLAERLQDRVCQLEAIARLNGETIRNQQRAAAEAERAQYRISTQNAGAHDRR